MGYDGNRDSIGEDVVKDIVATLTPTQLRACQLKAQGMSRREAAQAMGISLFRVRNLWHNARVRMLEAMPPKLREFYAKDRDVRKPTNVRAYSLSDLFY